MPGARRARRRAARRERYIRQHPLPDGLLGRVCRSAPAGTGAGAAEGGTLTLLHVLDGFPYETPYSGGAAFRLIGEYRAQVDRISREMRNAVPSDAFNWCHIDTVVVSGVAHRTIVATASELNTDLIVLGLPERSGIDRVIMASTATPVLRSAVCPVLMVGASEGAVSRVGVGDIVATPAMSEYTGPPMSPEWPRVQDMTV